MNQSNLKKRLFFAAWAIPLGWWIVNSNFSVISIVPTSILSKFPEFSNVKILPANILAIILTFLAASEYISMLSRLYPKNGFWLIYIWLGYQTVSYFVPDNFLSWNKDTYVLLMLVAFEAFLWGKKGRWKRASLLFSGTTFLVIACLSMLDFYSDPFQKMFPAKYATTMLSQLGVVTVVSAIFLCDSMAFFAGSYFGKHHFSTISPKKTIEGSIAGLIASTLTVSIGWYFFADDKFHIILGIFMGILIGIFAQLGDLLVSLMKRYFNVKDASNMIPGHGGILDRFDSVFFTAPIINLYLIIINKIIT